MADYIDRKKIFPNGVFFANENNPLASLDELIKRIWSIPTADVVEVVRCKDCKHGILCLNMAGADYVDCELDDYSTRLPHDFCSYGERRDG